MKIRLHWVILLTVFCSSVNGQSSSWAWAQSSSGNTDGKGKSTVTDANGNLFVTGFFQSPSITFGTITLNNAGSEDIFIVKYDPSGNVLWAKSTGGTGLEEGLCISTDAGGNLFLTGFFTSPSLIFGTTTLTSVGGPDIFVVKYDPSGNVLWAKSAGGASEDRGMGISTDNFGNVFVTGYFKSPSITFGATTLSASYQNVFVVKYSSAGNVIWAKSGGGTSEGRGFGISTDTDGNALVTGYFSSLSINFGTTSLTNNGYGNIFVLKYDSTGNVVWAKSVGGTNDDEATSVSTDTTGNVFVTGYFSSPSITFGSTTFTNAGTVNIFVVKYNPSGNILWAKSAGGSSYDIGLGICNDVAGNAFVTGYFSSPISTFGTTTLTNTGICDVFVVKYAPSGNVLWTQSPGGISDDYGRGISTDNNGNVIVTGSFGNNIAFGTTTLTNSGGPGVFVAKIEVFPIGIKEVNNSTDGMIIYPNPTSGNLVIEITDDPALHSTECKIHNVLGQEVLRSFLIDSKTQINLDLPKGVYFLELISEGNSAGTRRLIVE